MHKSKEKTMNPYHEVVDQDKVESLAKSMERDGWQGSPLVKWDVYGDLITGVHRYAAAQSLGWADSEIPMIDIGDVFTEAGLNFDAVLKGYDNPYLSDAMFVSVLYELPDAMREKYGIDIH